MKRVLFFVASLSLPFLFKQATLGFQPAKLHPRLQFHDAWESPPLSPDKEREVAEILGQPFTYFNLGSQSYVFLSQDQQVVLKLFRYNRSQFRFIEQVKGWFKQKRLKLNFLEKFDKTFQACAMGFAEAPDCTQILYIHLNPTNGQTPRPVAITDPIGRRWRLDLNQVRFILQRKAEPFKTTLLAAYQSGDRENMERMLDSVVELLYERTGKGIRNSDPNYGPNFGFYQGRAIEIDCGNYRRRPELALPEERIKEMHRFNSQLYKWLQNNAPEYAPYLRSRYEKIYGEINSGQAASPYLSS